MIFVLVDNLALKKPHRECIRECSKMSLLPIPQVRFLLVVYHNHRRMSIPIFLFPPKPTEYIKAEKDFVDTVRKMGYNEEQIPFYKCIL